MQISVEDAQDKLDELVDRALAGEEIILVLDGHPTVRLEPAEMSNSGAESA